MRQEPGSQSSSTGMKRVLWHCPACRNPPATSAQGLQPFQSRSGVLSFLMDRFSLQEHLQGPATWCPRSPAWNRVAITCFLPIRMTVQSFGEMQLPSFPPAAPV